MTLTEQLNHFDKLTEEMRRIIQLKGADYAENDKLSNFKTAGPNAGITPSQNCLSLIATKVARLGVLLKSDKLPSNESISDSVIDLSNYSILLHMLLNEGLYEDDLPFKI